MNGLSVETKYSFMCCQVAVHRVNMIVWPKATARGRVQEGNMLPSV